MISQAIHPILEHSPILESRLETSTLMEGVSSSGILVKVVILKLSQFSQHVQMFEVREEIRIYSVVCTGKELASRVHHVKSTIMHGAFAVIGAHVSLLR